MELPLRSIATLVLAVGLGSCSDTPNAPVKTATSRSRILLAPRFSSEASAVYAQRSEIAGVQFDRVRVRIVRPPSEVVVDTTIVFGPNSSPVTLDLNVEARQAGEVFDGSIDYTSNGTVVFHGQTKVQSHAPEEPAPAQQEILIEYVGLGANAARVTLTPATTTIPAQSSFTFAATVTDANNVAIPNVPLLWASSDPSVATLVGAGTIQSTGKRGTVTITATTLTNKSATASVTVMLPPAGIVLISGGGQTGKAGASLANSAVVKVAASDGVGVGGAVVNFAAPIGGAVGSSSVTTDASGMASTSLKLGGLAGPQSFAASVAGFSVSIPATATAGDPAAIVVVSGDKQADSVKRTLGSPLVVKVTDAFGNAVSGATVSWSRSGSGTLTSATSVTNTDGFASIGYTLGSTVGAETITASVNGVANGATFTATAFASSPAAIAIVSGGTQTGRIGQALGAPFVVKVTDIGGNPAPNATVTWTTTSGTIAATSTTDAQGVASNTLTLGTALGNTTVTATIVNGKSVTFTITVQVGTVAKIAFRTMPPQTVAAGVSFEPPVQVVLLDAGGNLTSAANTVTIALGGSPTGAVMTGTLSRNAVNGVATFDDLQFNKPGPYTLVASSAGTSSITSSGFSVTPGAPVKLAITTQPSTAAQSGIAFAQQPSVQLLDMFDNPVPQSGVTVSTTVASGSGAVNGTSSVATNASGVAVFTNLRLNGTVGNFTVSFNSTGLSAATSNTIVLSPGTAAVVGFSTQPSSSTAGTAFAPAVAVRDVDGNTVATATNAITVAITTGTGQAGAVLTGTKTVAASAGVSSFAGLSINLAATNYTLTASASGLTSSNSATFAINAGPPATLAIFAGNNQFFPSNFGSTRAAQSVIVRDAFTNPVPGTNVTFSAGAGATANGVATSVVATNSGGVADVFTGVTATSGTVTVTATVAALPPATLTATRTNQGGWFTQCARTTTNAAYCWGDNSMGTIGDGTTTATSVPSAVAGGLTFTSFTPEYGGHRCAVASGGAAYCWGRNDYGALGDNTTTNRLVPTPVAGGLSFTLLTTSSYATCGLTTTNQMYCWGWTGGGTLGDGDVGTLRTVPTLVNTGGRVFTKIVVLDDYACGLESAGVLSCWGQTPGGTVVTATPVPGAPALTSISAGFYHVCGITAAGAGYCMASYNAAGVTGNGSTASVPVPSPVSGGLTFAEIVAHAYNTCGRTTVGVLYCWGDNTFGGGGQIGDGTAGTNRTTPALVLGGITFSSLLGGGAVHTCAVANTGQPFCWGSGSQLGDGSGATSRTPVPVQWVQGTAGVARSIVVATGNNGSGQAGAAIGAPPTVLVRDYAGNPVANATVTFTVTGGGGSLTGGTVQTDSFGNATVGSWTLGATPGVNTMTATISGIGTVIFTATGT